MIYSNFYLKEKIKLPFYVGIIITVFVFAFFIRLLSKTPSTSIRANFEGVLRVEIANISPIQATIIWQTKEKDQGWILWGTNEKDLKNIAYDDRDIKESKGSFTNHFVTLRNLSPNQKYYYVIISSNKLVKKPDNSLFSFKTPLTPPSINRFKQFYGKILQPNLIPEKNALVLLYVDKTIIPLAAITKESGEWLIPLNAFYLQDTLLEKVLSGNEVVKVEIVNENREASYIVSNLNKLSLMTETIITGKNYDFSESKGVLSATTESQDNQKNIDIIYPKENAIIPGKKPLIKGIAVPNSKIKLDLNAKKTYSSIINVDKYGRWSYLTPDNLDLGNHKITIETNNENGEIVKITRSFSIIANDASFGRVLGASDEGEISISPTVTPKVSVSTITPTETIPLTPTTPVSGGANFTPFLLGSLSFIVMGVGFLLVF